MSSRIRSGVELLMLTACLGPFRVEAAVVKAWVLATPRISSRKMRVGDDPNALSCG